MSIKGIYLTSDSDVGSCLHAIITFLYCPASEIVCCEILGALLYYELLGFVPAVRGVSMKSEADVLLRLVTLP